jgi:hypothetical protein
MARNARRVGLLHRYLTERLISFSATGSWATVGGAAAAVSGAPLTLLTYSGPVSNDVAAVNLAQDIAASDALRTGSYGKTLTFTLSTTTP